MITKNNIRTQKVKLKDLMVTVPKSLSTADIFIKTADRRASVYMPQESNNINLIQTVMKQHPLINAWMLSTLFAITVFCIIMFVI